MGSNLAWLCRINLAAETSLFISKELSQLTAPPVLEAPPVSHKSPTDNSNRGIFHTGRLQYQADPREVTATPGWIVDQQETP